MSKLESRYCVACRADVTHELDAAGEWKCLRCAPAPQPPTQAEGAVVAKVSAEKKTPKGYVSIDRLLIIGVLLACLIGVMGFVHIVHGGNVGLKVCQKEEWGLGDTFVDLNDYIGKPLISKLDKARVLRAMFACGALERPERHEHSE